ncbi:MAG: thioesterase family protein [Elusimicrobiota bacterium]
MSQGPFKTAVDVVVRFRDTDALGHVNNAVYLSYIEMVRFEYAKRVFKIKDWREIDFIVARAEVDYRSPAFVGETLTASGRVCRFGGASFDMEYRILDKATGRLVAEAKTVQVSYDYQNNRVKRLTEAFLKTVGDYDGV